MKTAAFALIALALAAGTAGAAPPVNTYQLRLKQLDKPRQAAAMRGAIVESGQRCGRIDPPVDRGAYKNMFLWAARCTPGGDYAIYIGPDGSAQVRDCAEAAKLKLPACNLPPAKPAPKRR
ncbi:hypothetical protein [Sphingomonas solaris]|uniref:DUF4189 domain-containing protein n=1 Tax=Alterirhizorhabdus solaris TaxID=2529389 RepID=A0A558QYR1_9SPHN|nr:hypothetical protein [Sphingomonas solaris]TVV72238.1 hypothetical protein FOY91_14940 [Sphingomonas solaris]